MREGVRVRGRVGEREINRKGECMFVCERVYERDSERKRKTIPKYI